MTQKIPSPPSIERRALDIVSASPTATRHVSEFWAEYAEVFHALRATLAFARLDGIRQLGLKRGTLGVPGTMVPFCGGQEAGTTALDPFTRRDHSERMCATALSLCALHGVTPAAMLHAAVAALLHDIGHPAFSHTVEPILHRHGLPDHEEAGRRIVRGNAEIQAIFSEYDVDTERVIAIVEEKGDFGIRQSLCDTLTYLVHDSRTAGRPLGGAYAWHVLQSVRSVRDGAIDVEDSFVLKEFLEQRHAMTVDVYEHPYNRVNSLLVCETLDWLARNDHLDVAAIPDLNDADVLHALDVATTKRVPAWIRSARRFLTTQPAETRHWTVSEHGEESSARALVATATADRPCFLLPPIDFTGKSLPVRLPDGTVSPIRVSPTSRPRHHRVWHTVAYAGPL